MVKTLSPTMLIGGFLLLVVGYWLLIIDYCYCYCGWAGRGKDIVSNRAGWWVFIIGCWLVIGY